MENMMEVSEARWTTLVRNQKLALVNSRTRTYVTDIDGRTGLFTLRPDKSLAKKFSTMAELLRFVGTHQGPHIGAYNIVVLEPQTPPWRLVTELV